MASISFFIRGKVADKESTIWAKFRDRDIDIRVPVPVPYLSCKPKEWKDGKCKMPSKKMRKDDTETINTRLAQLEVNLIQTDFKKNISKIWVQFWVQKQKRENVII
ncbi:hypothetical protein [Chryseobacterium rhizosphaerae]|uniref:hypothetical protein n=1 Tax=Chryseobacterium rhizosphaerae TaxID=395937 RepID=UPI00235A1585|nr:hypothetical protein [Chryseobacterium rhizosphaerae]MDC8098425.1 hypothetical protein [Chryseobacterium rhizosphaerae]